MICKRQKKSWNEFVGDENEIRYFPSELGICAVIALTGIFGRDRPQTCE